MDCNRIFALLHKPVATLALLVVGVAAPMGAEAATTIPLFTNTNYPGGWGPGMTSTVTLPDSETMHGFTSMQVVMDMACPSSGCPPWDFVANLYLCPKINDPNGSTCNLEIARWITAYGKAGAWTTDITPMLALLQTGGPKEFYFWTPQAYTLNVSLMMDANGTGVAPSRALPLFQGGNLDPNFNPSHKPVTITLAQKPAKAQLVALVTGHGWGDNAEDCAEFCNMAEHFGIDGQDYSVDFPQAGSATGCQDLVAQGVVPDQAGTWQYGRDGWCPGWDVHPWVVDVTDSLQNGNNIFTYQALYEGQSYTPTPVSNAPADALAPSVLLSSYLVVWDAPAVVSDPNSAPTSVPPPTPSVPTPPSSAPTMTPTVVSGQAPPLAAAPDTTASCNAAGPGVFVWVFMSLLMTRRARRAKAS